MSMTKRTQGRPPRNSGMNGREKLIEATRLYLQSNRKLTLTRTEIAQGCGVTPALISYYFKDKKSLLEAVTKPVLKAYRQRLTEICSSNSASDIRMKQVIALLVELNTSDGFLVECMLHQAGLEELDAEDRSSVQAFHDAIGGLVIELVEGGEWRQTDPAMAELALWGLCRAVGEAPRQSDGEVGRSTIEGMNDRVNFVYSLFEA